MIELGARYSAGEFLKTMVLEERGLTQKWLADKLECSERKISEICNSKRAISPMFAIELEKAFGISAEFWVTMQAKWDLQNARKKAA
jgi:addiction module HigA family antidote